MRTSRLGLWRSMVVALALAALTVAGCKSAPDEAGKKAPPTGPNAAVLKLFPSVGDVSDWKASGDAKVYGPAANTADGIEDVKTDPTGGADILQNYGYVKSAVRKYARGTTGETVTVRLFEMKNSNEAFGVFSVMGSGKQFPNIGLASRMSDTALALVKGPYFALIEYSGTNNSAPVLTEFGQWTASQIPAQGYLPSIFASFPLGSQEGERYFLHTFKTLASMPFFPKGDPALIERLLALSSATDIAIVGYPTAKTGVLNYLFVIHYPSDGEAEAACKGYREYLDSVAAKGGAESNVTLPESAVHAYVVGTLNAQENSLNDVLAKLIVSLNP